MRLAAVLALLAVLAPCRTDDAEAIISRNLHLAAAATAAEPEPDVDVASPEDDFEAFDAAAAARGPDKSPWFRRRLESSPDAQESLADLAQAAQAAALSDTPDDAADDETTRRLVDLLRARSTKARPPIFLVPGICSTRLMTWRKQKCRGPDLNVQDNVWLNMAKVLETISYDPRCWLECMKLGDNSTDPVGGCRVRADEGLDAISVLSPGLFTKKATTVFERLTLFLADALGYDVGSIVALGYDWRLAPSGLEARDGFFTSVQQRVEFAVRKNGRPGIFVAHSLGNTIVAHFVAWLRDGVGHPAADAWLARHVWGYIALSPPLLGAPGALRSVLSGESFGVPITEAQAREMQMTFPVTHLMNPIDPRGHVPAPWDHAWPDPFVTLAPKDGTAAAAAATTVAVAVGAAGDDAAAGTDADADAAGAGADAPAHDAPSPPAGTYAYGVSDVEDGSIFASLGDVLKDDAMRAKADSLQRDYVDAPVHPTARPPERPPFKHVVVAYGVEMPTDTAYSYAYGDEYDPAGPTLTGVTVEEAGGALYAQRPNGRGRAKVGQHKAPLNKSGDGLIPYVSLAWALTWLGPKFEVSSREAKVLGKKPPPPPAASAEDGGAAAGAAPEEALDPDALMRQLGKEHQKQLPAAMVYESRGVPPGKAGQKSGSGHTTTVMELHGVGHQDILINAHWLMPLREMLHRIDGDLCLVAGDEKPCAYLGADDVAPLCGKAGESWFGWMGCGLSSVASVLTGEAEQQAWTEAELLSGRDPTARPLEPPPLALPEAAEAAKRMLPSMDEAKRMLPNMDDAKRMLPKMDEAFKVIPDPTNMMNDVGRWAQEGAKTVEEGLLTGQEVARRFMTGLWRRGDAFGDKAASAGGEAAAERSEPAGRAAGPGGAVQSAPGEGAELLAMAELPEPAGHEPSRPVGAANVPARGP